MKEFAWTDFYKATKDNPHWSLLERAVSFLSRRGDALDLGCGAGRDTRYLLAQGFHVVAVDSSPHAVALLAGWPQERLRVVQSSFEDFSYEQYDLVNAQFALPFNPRTSFFSVFARVKQAIKPSGIFTGQFFGIHDEWNTPGTEMTFLAQEQVRDLLSDMQILEFTEEDKMGNTAVGGVKHWHVFHVIARKPTT